MDTSVGSSSTYTNFLDNCLHVKEEVEDVDYGQATESPPDIKHENVEIKSEEIYIR